MISLEKAIDILKDIKLKNEIENIDTINSLNKVVSEDIHSSINSPPFRKSAMDGYALNIKTNTQKLTKLKVVGSIYAGDVFDGNILDDECVKIMTGAKIPDMCNCVIKKEDVINNSDNIILNKEIKPNENICQIGEDIQKGQMLIPKNTKITYAHIGILASSGITKINVYKNKNIALLTTGSEVLDIDNELEDAKIYNSNKYLLLSRINELGYNVNKSLHIEDDLSKLSQIIKELSLENEIIITTGGVSVGDKDYIKQSIQDIDGKILFHKVQIKPGSAVLVAKYKNTIIISLSGNPNASLTTFELIAKPMINRLNNNYNEFIKRETAILVDKYNKKSMVRRFIRGNTYTKDELQYVSITQNNTGNGVIYPMLNSNCLIEIEKGNTGLEIGDKITIIKL